MSAKISVEKQVFINQPAVFLEVEEMSMETTVDESSVGLTPKAGFLIPVLVKLSKAKIPYALRYENPHEENTLRINPSKKI